MLGDTSSFAAGNVGLADGVEQRSLAVIDVAHDRDHRRTRNFQLVGILLREHVLDGLVCHLVLEGDHRGVCAELAGDILDQLTVERLVDGDEDATHEECRDQVLATHAELFGEILNADALRHGDSARDGQRLGGNLCSTETRWRSEALHRAFLGLLVLLAASARVGARTLRTRCLARRRHQPWRSTRTGTLSEAGSGTHTGALSKTGTRSLGCAARRTACRVHGATCAGSSWTSGSTHAGTLSWSSRWTAVEDGASTLNATGSRRCRRSWWSGLDRRSAVNRARPSLRHDYPTGSRSGLRWSRCDRRSSGGLDWCCRGSRCRWRRDGPNRRSGHRCRRCDGDWRPRHDMSWRRCGRSHFARCCGWRGNGRASGDNRRLRNHRAGGWFGGYGRRRRRSHNGRCLTRLRDDSAGSRGCGDGSRYGPFSCGSRYCHDRDSRLCSYRRYRSRGYGNRGRWDGPRRWSCRFFLLLLDRLEDVARLRNPRPVNLWLRCRLDAATTGRTGSAALEMGAHTLGFVEL